MSLVIGVVGSRDYPDLDRVIEYLEALREHEDLAGVVSGGARGVDFTAEDYAFRHRLAMVSFRPYKKPNGAYGIVRWFDAFPTELPGEYRSFGAACYVRNSYIVEFADEVVAFHDGGSKGTQHSIDLARRAGKLREIVRG